jgi:uroporphyrinogen III methyltransferase/synthase
MNTAGSAGSLSDSDGLGIDYEALVRTKGTLIFLMGLSTLPVIMRGLLDAGISPDTPAAVLERGTTAGQ